MNWVNKLIIQDLSKFKIPKGFRGASAFKVQLWWMVQKSIFAWSPQFAYSWRRFLLRIFGAKIGSGVVIRPSVKITYPWKLTIGDFAWIGDDVVLYTLGNIQIGNNSVISQRSYLCTGSHDYNSESFDIYAKPIVVLDEAWVATDVFIGPGVTIGRGCVVGARSSVYSDLPKMSLCVGNPAASVRSRVL